LKSKEHVNHAKSNEQLAAFLDGTPYPDWRATVFFYAAVHYVQAYFTAQPVRWEFHKHSDRDTAIQADNHISAIWDDYRSLKDWSRDARYDAEKPSADDFKNDILPSLMRIKKHLRAFVNTIT